MSSDGHGWPRKQLGGHFQRPVTAPTSWWSRMSAKSAWRPLPAFRDRSALLAVTHGREIDPPATSSVP